MALIIYLLSLTGLFILSAFFSGSETALFSLTRFQVRKLSAAHPKQGKIVSRLLLHPSRTLTTILTGNMLVNVAASSMVSMLFIKKFKETGVGPAIGLMTFLLLIFGEITPKTYAVRHALKVSAFAAWPLDILAMILYPLRQVLAGITNVFMRLAIRKKVTKKPYLTEKELKTMIDVGEQDGVIEEDEKEMIQAVFEFDETEVSEVMIPRVDMLSVEGTDSVEELIQLMRKTRHTRIPVYEETIDNILGVIYTREFLVEEATELRPFIRPIIFVPETMKLDDIFLEFQSKKKDIAIVVDEYGGTSGLITMEDILEEIVGEIYDEFDTPEEEIKKVSPNTYIVKGGVSLRDLNEELELDLPLEEADTLAGFLLEHLERFPKPQEKIKTGNIEFIVEHIKKNRIRLVTVKVK